MLISIEVIGAILLITIKNYLGSKKKKKKKTFTMEAKNKQFFNKDLKAEM